MLLTITTTHQPATDLGYLLHKHPDRFQSVDLSIGQGHVFYPESTEARCTIALLLDIDPIDMVRGARNLGGQDFTLGQYVNDRPYVASSFMSVALSKAFSTAMNGRCKDRPELVDRALPFMVQLSVVPAPRGGEALIRKLFEPLGYAVQVERHTLDDHFPDWGESKYYTLQLTHTITTQALLSHLYVLIPALDNDKHYYVGRNEIDKLLKKGRGWLETHPEREEISARYLINLRSLTRQAMERLQEGEDDEVVQGLSPEVSQRQQTLHEQRLALVLEQLKKTSAETVIDLGCGEGKLLRMLLKERQFTKIAGMDVSYRQLTKAKDRLRWDQLAPKQKERIELFHGALTYRDRRLEGYDAAAIVEVVEHLDPDRLASFERVVFEFARPKTVLITTPNAEYNKLFESMSPDQLRHADHRFEWTRKEFETWASQVAEKNNYQVAFLSVGPEDAEVGAPSQMSIFTHGA